jgi:phosphate transport system permease protein
MVTFPIFDVVSVRSSAERQLRAGRKFLSTGTRSELATVLIGVSSALLAFAGFLLVSEWTVLPFLVFLSTAGYGWVRHQEITAKALTLAMTASTVLVLVLIIVFIFIRAWPTIQYETMTVYGIPLPGLRMFVETRWNAAAEPIQYSMIPMIHGTVMVTIVATLVAGPLGVAAALFLSEIAPSVVREVVKPGVEILAGIPSIVYGFIGFTLLSPWASSHFDLVGQGTYLFVGVVVGLMALPTVVSVAEDALNSVPESMKSGSLAIGTTDWQTMTSITLPAAFSGVSSAVLLGVGRAIGETMAATVMLRNNPTIADPIFNVFYGYETLTSLIAANYGEATGLQMNALFVAGVILFITVLFISIGSQMIETRMQRKLGGVE